LSAPLIGIVAELAPHAEHRIKDEVRLRSAYPDAVLRAGGLPVILPVSGEPQRLIGVVERLDGVLFTGGWDIPPAAFGQEPHETVRLMEPEQFATWTAMMRTAIAAQRPLLAICAGLQIMNVTLGGSLIQDIPSQTDSKVSHRGEGFPDVEHAVEIVSGSRLAELSGAGRKVINSSHHQAIDRPGDGVVVTARCPDDGIIEAIELPGHPFAVGVQWHPERMPGDGATRKLFAGFVAACERR
jgi:putative glutamine amidotransferase